MPVIWNKLNGFIFLIAAGLTVSNGLSWGSEIVSYKDEHKSKSITQNFLWTKYTRHKSKVYVKFLLDSLTLQVLRM